MRDDSAWRIDRGSPDMWGIVWKGKQHVRYSCLQIGWIAAGVLVAVTTNDYEKDEENQDQREVVETIKDTHLLTPPTLVSILMLCRKRIRGMGECLG